MMLLRIIRNYKIFKAQRHSQKGEYDRAEEIVSKLIKTYPDAVAYNLFAADIMLYSGDMHSALERYKFVGQLLDQNTRIKKHNKRFMAAYTNFKIKAIILRSAGKPFPKAFELTKLINNLEADNNLKALFPLPKEH